MASWPGGQSSTGLLHRKEEALLNVSNKPTLPLDRWIGFSGLDRSPEAKIMSKTDQAIFFFVKMVWGPELADFDGAVILSCLSLLGAES